VVSSRSSCSAAFSARAIGTQRWFPTDGVARANLDTSPHTGAPSTFMSSDSGATTASDRRRPAARQAPRLPNPRRQAPRLPTTVAADSLVGEERETRSSVEDESRSRVVVDARRQARVLGEARISASRRWRSSGRATVAAGSRRGRAGLPAISRARVQSDRDDMLMPPSLTLRQRRRSCSVIDSAAMPAGAGIRNNLENKG